MIRRMLPWVSGLWLAERVFRQLPPLPIVPHVDLERFMGDWYVIGGILTPLEWTACNAVESYALDADGTVATTFSFRAGATWGPQQRFRSRGHVEADGSNAIWGMEFVPGVRADYRIIWLDPAYEVAMIGREARDLVWIMSRYPFMSDGDYDSLWAVLEDWGYRRGRSWRVPQNWPVPAAS